MPARKTPLGFRQKHYSAKQICEIFGVGKTKAYDIIHECVVYGEVSKIGSLRVSESALVKWYEMHTLTPDLDENNYKEAVAKAAQARAKAKRGRPRGGKKAYGEEC